MSQRYFESKNVLGMFTSLSINKWKSMTLDPHTIEACFEYIDIDEDTLSSVQAKYDIYEEGQS